MKAGGPTRAPHKKYYTSVDLKYIFGTRTHSVLGKTRIPSSQPGWGNTMPRLGKKPPRLDWFTLTLPTYRKDNIRLDGRYMGGGGPLLEETLRKPGKAKKRQWGHGSIFRDQGILDKMKSQCTQREYWKIHGIIYPRWSGGRGTFATGNGRNPTKTLGKCKKRQWGHGRVFRE